MTKNAKNIPTLKPEEVMDFFISSEQFIVSNCLNTFVLHKLKTLGKIAVVLDFNVEYILCNAENSQFVSYPQI